MKRRLSSLALVVPILVAAAPAGAEGPLRLSFTDAVRKAADDSPEVAAAAFRAKGAARQVSSSKALRLPKVTAEGNLLYWDKELAFELASPGMMPPPGTEVPEVVVRERLTATATVTVAQPLSNLIAIQRLVDIDEAGAGAATADLLQARLDAAARAGEAYLAVLEARAAREIAETRVTQVEAQLERARVLQEGGVLQRVDVMRLEAAWAATRQGALGARTAERLAIERLAVTVGLPPHTELAVVDDLPDPPSPPTLTASAAADAARARRPELVSARKRAEQAAGAEGVALSRLVPNVVGVATYQRSEGGGALQPRDSWFVGLTLQWDLWDWGKNWQAKQAAAFQAQAASLQAERVGDYLALESRARALAARTAYEALDVARAGLDAAEEAYRIQGALFAEGAATTTDLLQSETEVTRARQSFARARYAYYTALVQLARATGRFPDELVTGGTLSS